MSSKIGSSKCVVKATTKKGSFPSFSVKFDKLTQGEVLSMINALRIARKISPVANDLSAYLRNAFHDMETEKEMAQEFMDWINSEIDVVLLNNEVRNLIVEFMKKKLDALSTAPDSKHFSKEYELCKKIHDVVESAQ